MNHAELSKQLALALGYYQESVRITQTIPEQCVVFRVLNVNALKGPIERWFGFDYRDPSVALAMVELLLSEYAMCIDTRPFGKFTVGSARTQFWLSADTLPEAAARAVIALKGMK